MSIGAWISLWAFYFVPLIYVSIFVPVPYCLDDCGFVVEPEVRQVDSSSSILLSQDCLVYYKNFWWMPFYKLYFRKLRFKSLNFRFIDQMWGSPSGMGEKLGKKKKSYLDSSVIIRFIRGLGECFQNEACWSTRCFIYW